MKTTKNKIIYEEVYPNLKGKAQAIVYPDSIEEIFKLIRSSQVDIIPRGNGTSFTGACLPKNSIIVDMLKFNRLLELDLAKKTVLVEAGMLLNELNEILEEYDLEFPVNPAFFEAETIGGLIAKNTPGIREIKYGRIMNWVEYLVVLNSKAEKVKIPKSELSDFLGMEGTTGIILRTCLRLTKKKQRSITILKSEKLRDLLKAGLKLKIDQEICCINLLNPTVSSLLGFEKKYHLFVEFDTPKGFFKQEDYKKYLGIERKAYKKIATEGLPLIENFKIFSDNLEDIFIHLEENSIPYISNVSSGVVYCFFRNDSIGQIKAEQTLNFARKLKAKISYNFGIGLNKKQFLDASEIDLLKRVKKRQDPDNKFNKLKLIDYKKTEKLSIIPPLDVEKEIEIVEEEKKEFEEQQKELDKIIEEQENKEIFEEKFLEKPKKREDMSEEEKEKIKKIAFGFFGGK